MSGRNAEQLASIAEKNRYFYHPLQSPMSVRLLELQAGSRKDVIRCRLITVESLDLAPSYEALSHCWGLGAKTKVVSCNDEVQPFMITENLSGALSHLRFDDRNRLLWIDALCINQHDLSERSQQVSIMRLIYANASKVFVWLGVTDNMFVATIGLIKSIARSCCVHRYGANDPESWHKLLSEGPRYPWLEPLEQGNPAFNLPDSNDVCWEKLGHFFDLPWFFRVWVIQEVQSCDDVQVICGEDIMDWNMVTLVATWFRASLPGRLPIQELRRRAGNQGAFMGTSQMYFMNLRPLTTHQEAPFLRLLDRAQSFQSSEPKDKIYALLTHSARRCACRVQHTDCEEHIVQYSHNRGVIGTARHLDIDIDYTLPIVELLCRVTLRSIEQYESLETLNYAWKVRRELFSTLDHLSLQSLPADTKAYPSWVPQWDAVINNRRPHFRAYLYNACLDLKPVMRKCATTNSIILRGVFVDTVKEANVALRTDGSFNNQTFLEKRRWRSSEDDMVSFSRILAQDHKHHIAGKLQGVDALHERATANIQGHFANFAAYVCKILERKKAGVFVSLIRVACHVCDKAITRLDQTHEQVPTAQNCRLCHMGAFDICSECYSAGERCLDPEHTIRPRNLQGFWCQCQNGANERLAKVAPDGVAAEFALAARSAFDRRSAFSTAHGLTGMCPLLVMPSDIVVVLFGGRTPYILRKTADHYRLVSDCYVYGIMDGEAVGMWQDGDLDPRDFELQ